MSIWISAELKEQLDKYCNTYTDKSRSRWICEAIKEFLKQPGRQYLLENNF